MSNHLTAACVLALLLGCRAGAEPTDALRPAGIIPLEGVEGRIDHMAADAKAGRLYVAALGNNTLEVIDLAAGRRVRGVGGLKKPQGIALVPDLNRVAVASGDD